jgi:dTDP-4-dehydrorhamnose 3,5-epimerase
MKFIKTKIPDVIEIRPKVFEDDRGYFYESFRKDEFEKNIGKVNFIQHNESKSSFGVLRGLHFQKPPFAQSKLVRALQGRVLDVVVDIRIGSPYYGKYVSVLLDSVIKNQLWVPQGFAHGFVVLSEDAIFSYLVDNYYAPDYDSGIMWNDDIINVDWKINSNDIILSDKDKRQNKFEKETIFNYQQFTSEALYKK